MPDPTNSAHSAQFNLSGLDFATGHSGTGNGPGDRALVSVPPDDVNNTQARLDVTQTDHNLHTTFDQSWFSGPDLTSMPSGVGQCWLEKLPKRPSPSTGKLMQVHWDCDVCSDRKLDRRRRSQWCCGLCRRGVCPNECFKKHVLMRSSKFVDLHLPTT